MVQVGSASGAQSDQEKLGGEEKGGTEERGVRTRSGHKTTRQEEERERQEEEMNHNRAHVVIIPGRKITRYKGEGKKRERGARTGFRGFARGAKSSGKKGKGRDRSQRGGEEA